MLNSNVKLLIYDLLELIDNDNFESCQKIEQDMKKGKLISSLLDKYSMRNFIKTDIEKVSALLKERTGCNEITYKNGLIYLIEILLDCE